VITANAAAGGPTGNGLFVANGGTLLLNTTLNAGLPLSGQTGSYSDMLIVDGTQLGTGATAISVFNKGGLGAVTAGNGIALVEVRNKTLSQPGVFVLNGDFVSNGQQAVAGGLYAYALQQNGVGADANDGNWYLRSLVGPNGSTPLYQPGVALYEAYPAILRRLNTLPTFRQRVGERYYDPANRATGDGQSRPAGGVWGRLEAGRDYSDPGLTASGTSFETTGLRMQVAADGLLHESAQGKLIAALTAQYGTSHSTVSSAYGTGTVGATTYGLGGTLSWLDGSGFYADGQLGVNWYDSDLFSNELRRAVARQNSGMGLATSIEVGQDLWLDDHWKLTPQAQLIYSNTMFDSFSDSYGATVTALGGDSLRGRLGLAANYLNTWQDSAGETSSLDTTAIVNVYNEFLPTGEVQVAGTRLGGRSDSLWGGIGLGATYAWADGKYSLYGDVSASTGLANFGSSATLHGALGLKVRW
ncbi:autotransporter outer membrane beta-barrel domain-containing protein, partial [Devosia sp.]|uniref:autotransporter family protein n=1 Tax=Devosia sp. TaxID=1871048 RepID=UPI001AC79BAE